MKHLILIGALGVTLSGCSTMQGVIDGLRPAPFENTAPPPVDPFVQSAPEVDETALTPATAAPPPPPLAQTAEALDTTTPEQRAAAAAPSEVPNRALGMTVVSLGSPTEPGLWLKTPLVSEAAQGRVTNPANGKSSLVSLIPLEGEATAGSRMSLGALRLIGASLTSLTEIEVALEG